MSERINNRALGIKTGFSDNNLAESAARGATNSYLYSKIYGISHSRSKEAKSDLIKTTLSFGGLDKIQNSMGKFGKNAISRSVFFAAGIYLNTESVNSLSYDQKQTIHGKNTFQTKVLPNITNEVMWKIRNHLY